MKTAASNTINLNVDRYRKLVQHYLDLHMNDTALFWADKVVTLTDNPQDVYWLAECMYHLKQYRRAVNLLKLRKLEKTYLSCNYLAVKCLYEAGDLTNAMKLVSNLGSHIKINFTQITGPQSNFKTFLFDDKPKNVMYASICFMKGKVFEGLDNRILAAECYKQALQLDVYCFEAFDALTKNQMLTASEEKTVLNALPFSTQCTQEEAETLRFLYETKLKKYQECTNAPLSTIKIVRADRMQLGSNVQLNVTPYVISNLTPKFLSTPSISTPNLPVPKEGEELKKEEVKQEKCKNMETEQSNLQVKNPYVEKLKGNLEVLVAHAERHYYNCQFQECSLLTNQILAIDPWHMTCLAVHISCSVELKDANRIYRLAHELVEMYPTLPIAWYTVGCYYCITGKSDQARKHLLKATTLDKLFGPAWLAYGHSYALENEHDQAMAAYFKASQLMKGCHLPLLYMGLGCGLTNNIRLAEKFFHRAHTIAPDDPFVLHERAVVNYHNHEYTKAEEFFRAALDKICIHDEAPLEPRWAPLLNNLGHTMRKLKKYEEALFYHIKALALLPKTPSIYSAIGFVHALMGNTQKAVEWFHKTLGLDRGDTFSSTMLNCLLEELVETEPPFEGAPLEIPKFVASQMRRMDSALESTLGSNLESNFESNMGSHLVSNFNQTSRGFDRDISMSTESSIGDITSSYADNPPPPLLSASEMSIEVDMEVTKEDS